MKLWLDDVRDPIEHGAFGWVWALTATQAIEFLKAGEVEMASLDHDLGVNQTLAGMYGMLDDSHDTGSGYDVILWLEQNPEFWPKRGVRVHSANPAGRARMEQVVKKHYGRLFTLGELQTNM